MVNRIFNQKGQTLPDEILRQIKYPQRKRQRLIDYDYATPGVYYVTVCSFQKQPFFAAPSRLAEMVVGSFLNKCEKTKATWYSYVLMPNHFHCLLSNVECLEKADISCIIGEWKSFTTHESWSYGHRGKLWQRSFYDHIVRISEYISEIMDYIVHNPVRWGLVEHWEMYPYCGINYEALDFSGAAQRLARPRGPGPPPTNA